MSYDIRLVDSVTGETLEVESPHFMQGGTYALGGTKEMWLNVTYNYGALYRSCLDEEGGIRVLDGMSAFDSIPILESAIGQLSDEVDDDYWRPTEGNAKKALVQLLTMAKMCPDGVWEVS